LEDDSELLEALSILHVAVVHVEREIPVQFIDWRRLSGLG
jgi:hypothetical protein